ncbi:MAG: 23S rRNA pseudouridine(955/2504/2580) synthase RluC [Gammaproteobacteria bacterium]|jgi:23S rRNA pseudouridine955/2504/2580 synthase
MNEFAPPKRFAPELVEIDSRNEGQRIDNFLTTYLKGVPKSFIYRVLRRGEVRVNKGRIKPDYKLRRGDAVRIPPVRRDASPTVTARPGDRLLELVDQNLLYEDEGLIVLNKPAGIAVHGGSGISFGVIEILRAARPRAPFLELAHRLDRDTSGCLIIAKKRSTLRHLHQLLREHGIDKRYVALLQGSWHGGEHRVNAPLRRNILRSGERVVRVAEDGKPSYTLFRPQQSWEQASLVEALPRSGRTHQIRVHAAHLHQPIAGDEKYGDAGFNRAMQDLGLRRLFLHAAGLRFTTAAGQAVEVTAPLGPELQQVLDALGNG